MLAPLRASEQMGEAFQTRNLIKDLYVIRIVSFAGPPKSFENVYTGGSAGKMDAMWSR